MKNDKKTHYLKSGIVVILISACLIAIDQIAKLLITANLKGNPPLVLLDGVFELYYYENPYAAFNFGKFLDDNVFLTLVLILTAVFCGFLIYISFRVPPVKKYRIIRIILILFLAGALGNFIDRITHHYVVDFFYFVLINFPIFNIADIYVVFGAILFIVTALFHSSTFEELFPSKKKDEKKTSDKNEKEGKE